MDRRAFLVRFGIALLTSLSAEAQQAIKVRRIGYLYPGVGKPVLYTAFLEGLRELGYVDGQNIAIEFVEPTETSRGFLGSPPTWLASTWTCWWRPRI